MDSFVLPLLGAVIIAALVAAYMLGIRRRGTPPIVPKVDVESAPPEAAVRAKAASQLAADTQLFDGPEGTTKIDRSALQSIVGSREEKVEHAYFLVIAGEGVGRCIKLDRDEFVIGRDPTTTDICFRDDAISSQHARVRTKNGVIEIEDLGSSNGTFVDGEEIKRAKLVDGARVVLGRSTVLTLTFQDELGEKFQKQMWESSTRDGLTKAYNKATFLDLLESEMHFAERHGTNYCIAIIDIDHFKGVNDQYGHLVGDEILASFAELIREVTRTEALFARYGGEEFVVAERSASLVDGERFAERIRSSTERHAFSTGAGVLEITVSIGVADLRSIDGYVGKDLIEAADNALYRAKDAGRNHVCLAKNNPE